MVKKAIAASSAQQKEDAEVLASLLPVAAQINHFLNANTDGRALFEALYDHILDEPVPPKLRDLLPK